MARRRLAALARYGGLALVACLLVAPLPATAAETPSPFTSAGPDATADTTTPEEPAIQAPDLGQNAETTPTATINPGVGKVGDVIRLAGLAWPSSSAVVATTCGNRGIGGSEVCAESGTSTYQADTQGTISGPFTLRKPPVPCPCVVHVTSPQTIAVVDLPVTIRGLATGEVVNNTTDTRVSSSVKVSGNGPVLWSWFGGKAERTAAVTLSNLGSDQIENVQLNVTIGKGQDPTDKAVVVQAGALRPGEVKVVQVPFTLDPFSFGEYTVKVSLANVTATNEAVRAKTSVFPWLLVVLLWLILQPLLLGLYKRRPVTADGDEDPFAPGAGGPSPAPVPAGLALTAATARSLDEEFGPSPALYDPFPPAAYVPAATGAYLVPAVTRALVPNYHPVFGVTDLRAYLDPAAAGRATQTVAPRIVIGGVIPRQPAPAPVYDPAADPAAWPNGAAEQNGHGPL